ncbi:lipid-binding SYLF domain-containing protein [Silvibacterium acidisoli]|uniref:lipid-binding SYLF domain-containing protein n=1 Tax=Acidobacteriaceae bacterium ZG23-2 TaxID=2883246 RepID=UPI00406D0021
MKQLWALGLCVGLCIPMYGQDKEKVTDRIADSTAVLRQLLATPDKGIPSDLLDRSECVIVYPSVKKAAFIVGASYGRGVITCRTGRDLRGPWSAPAMFALEGGSVGFQIGGQATDFVLLVMNDQGAQSVLKSKVKLGGDASIAAGPVGRNTSAETDIVMKAQILSWSRTRGIFAGISLAGSTMRSDNDSNKALYGRSLTATEIVRDGAVPPPVAARPLLHLLNRVTPGHRKK